MRRPNNDSDPLYKFQIESIESIRAVDRLDLEQNRVGVETIDSPQGRNRVKSAPAPSRLDRPVDSMTGENDCESVLQKT